MQYTVLYISQNWTYFWLCIQDYSIVSKNSFDIWKITNFYWESLNSVEVWTRAVPFTYLISGAPTVQFKIKYYYTLCVCTWSIMWLSCILLFHNIVNVSLNLKRINYLKLNYYFYLSFSCLWKYCTVLSMQLGGSLIKALIWF